MFCQWHDPEFRESMWMAAGLFLRAYHCNMRCSGIRITAANRSECHPLGSYRAPSGGYDAFVRWVGTTDISCWPDSAKLYLQKLSADSAR